VSVRSNRPHVPALELFYIAVLGLLGLFLSSTLYWLYPSDLYILPRNRDLRWRSKKNIVCHCIVCHFGSLRHIKFSFLFVPDRLIHTQLLQSNTMRVFFFSDHLLVASGTLYPFFLVLVSDSGRAEPGCLSVFGDCVFSPFSTQPKDSWKLLVDCLCYANMGF